MQGFPVGEGLGRDALQTFGEPLFGVLKQGIMRISRRVPRNSRRWNDQRRGDHIGELARAESIFFQCYEIVVYDRRTISQECPRDKAEATPGRE